MSYLKPEAYLSTHYTLVVVAEGFYSTLLRLRGTLSISLESLFHALYVFH
jgi:hypothetical protein